MDRDADLRSELALGCRIVAGEGLGDFIWGHVSVRAPESGTFWMKGARIGLEEATDADLLLLDLDGNVLAGDRARHAEWPIHSEVYRARPDVGSVVHSHALHTVAFGTTDEPLLPICHESIRWVPPDVPRFTETSDLIDTPELGRAVAAAMGQADGIFLRNHGTVVAGADLHRTCLQAIFLERACRTQLLAMSSGVPYHPAPQADAESRRQKMSARSSYEALWEYFARRFA